MEARMETHHMSCNSSVVAACVLTLGLSSAALAASSAVTTTETKSAVVTGTVQAASANTLTVRGANGVQTYVVPESFKLRLGEREVGVDQLEPGMPITADITNEITTRNVTESRKVEGKVVQVTPGGFVLLDPRNQYVSYNFQDERGNDYRYRAPDGQDAPLHEVKLGEHLSGEMVTHFPPQIIDERIVQLDVAVTPGLATAPDTSSEGAPATGASR